MNEPPPLAPAKPNSQLATWSMVLGILGVVLCVIGPLFGIPAIICAHLALSRIKKSGGLLAGNGRATAGLIMGYLSIAMILVIAIAIPNFVKARYTSASNSCINNMRQIDSATQQWALETGKKDTEPPDPVAIATYIKGEVLPTCPQGGTYKLGATVGTVPIVTCSHPRHILP